jgi:hypothetical protein
MCIPHGAARTTSNNVVKKTKPKKQIKKPSKEMLEKGDPDFVDERKSVDESEKKESFFDKLFKD